MFFNAINNEVSCMQITEKTELYINKLLALGMLQPAEWQSSMQYRFYKPTTPLTAFIVNLTVQESAIEIVYGYASTAFTRMAGDENTLIENGVCDEEINLREKVIIYNDTDEETANAKIKAMYAQYLHTEKDELIKLTKEKRKQFINQIATKLKPLGFKKKANSWTKPLDANYYVMFNVQKSDFSDEYYFNIYIGKNGTSCYGDCCYTRISPNEEYPTDWQTISHEAFESFMEDTAVATLQDIINTPLKALGKRENVWHCCTCSRKECAECWVEKNLWEAQQK